MEEPKKKSSRLRMNFKIFFFHACVLKAISGRNNLSEIGLFYMLFQCCDRWFGRIGYALQ